MTVNRDTRSGIEHLAADDFRALLEAGREPIAVLGEGGVIRYASPACAALLGESPEELQGHSLFDWLAPESVPPVSKALADALGGATSVRFDVVLADDASSSMRSTLGPFRDSSDRACAVLRWRASTGHEAGATLSQTAADRSAMSRFPDSTAATGCRSRESEEVWTHVVASVQPLGSSGVKPILSWFLSRMYARRVSPLRV